MTKIQKSTRSPVAIFARNAVESNEIIFLMVVLNVTFMQMLHDFYGYEFFSLTEVRVSSRGMIG